MSQPPEILYPNGQVLAAQMFIDPGTGPEEWDGSVSIGPVTITGVATSANQTNGSQKTQVVDGSGNVISSTGNALDINVKTPATLPISGTVTANLGTIGSAATSAKQDTGNTSLASIDTKLTNPLPISGTVTANIGTVGTLATAAKQDTGNASLSSIDGKVPSLGQALAASSVPVVLTAGQVTTLTPPAAITGFALEVGHIATVDTSTAASAAVEGTTSGAAVTTDSNGTIQQYLRGIVKLLIANTIGVVLQAGSSLIGYIGFKSTYAGKVTLTTTNWVSLTNGSGWQSVDIATNGARDCHIWLETQSTGTAYCDFYIATKLSNGTGYTDGASGSEGTFTAANRLNSRSLGSLRINNAQAQGEFYLSDIFGGAIPANFAIIGINNSGATINATGSNTVFEYELVN